MTAVHSIVDFVNDYNRIVEMCNSGPLKTFAWKRLKQLVNVFFLVCKLITITMKDQTAFVFRISLSMFIDF